MDSSFIVIFLSAEYTLAATKIVRIVFYTAATLGENPFDGVAEYNEYSSAPVLCLIY